ncbi:unnamed protein product, partial [Rotaria sp. Silwood1]
MAQNKEHKALSIALLDMIQLLQTYNDDDSDESVLLSNVLFGRVANNFHERCLTRNLCQDDIRLPLICIDASADYI